MTPSEALKIALREVDREYRRVKANVMADPRAAELRQEKLTELDTARQQLVGLAL